ncbi:MAG: thioesterase family protein [Tepidisphaeraceae bacterium]
MPAEPLKPIVSITLPIRVRYPEADPMGYLHHSVYLQYFEMGRIELLRAGGHSYADLEAAGVFFVVTKLDVKYRAPARFDDELTLTVHLVRQGPVRLDHAYELRKGEQLLAEANTTIACVGRDGQVRQIPDDIVAK